MKKQRPRATHYGTFYFCGNNRTHHRSHKEPLVTWLAPLRHLRPWRNRPEAQDSYFTKPKQMDYDHGPPPQQTHTDKLPINVNGNTPWLTEAHGDN